MFTTPPTSPVRSAAETLASPSDYSMFTTPPTSPVRSAAETLAEARRSYEPLSVDIPVEFEPSWEPRLLRVVPNPTYVPQRTVIPPYFPRLSPSPIELEPQSSPVRLWPAITGRPPIRPGRAGEDISPPIGVEPITEYAQISPTPTTVERGVPPRIIYPTVRRRAPIRAIRPQQYQQLPSPIAVSSSARSVLQSPYVSEYARSARSSPQRVMPEVWSSSETIPKSAYYQQPHYIHEDLRPETTVPSIELTPEFALESETSPSFAFYSPQTPEELTAPAVVPLESVNAPAAYVRTSRAHPSRPFVRASSRARTSPTIRELSDEEAAEIELERDRTIEERRALLESERLAIIESRRVDMNRLRAEEVVAIQIAEAERLASESEALRPQPPLTEEQLARPIESLVEQQRARDADKAARKASRRARSREETARHKRDTLARTEQLRRHEVELAETRARQDAADSEELDRRVLADRSDLESAQIAETAALAQRQIDRREEDERAIVLQRESDQREADAVSERQRQDAADIEERERDEARVASERLAIDRAAIEREKSELVERQRSELAAVREVERERFARIAARRAARLARSRAEDELIAIERQAADERGATERVVAADRARVEAEQRAQRVELARLHADYERGMARDIELRLDLQRRVAETALERQRVESEAIARQIEARNREMEALNAQNARSREQERIDLAERQRVEREKLALVEENDRARAKYDARVRRERDEIDRARAAAAMSEDPVVAATAVLEERLENISRTESIPITVRIEPIAKRGAVVIPPPPQFAEETISGKRRRVAYEPSEPTYRAPVARSAGRRTRATVDERSLTQSYERDMLAANANRVEAVRKAEQGERERIEGVNRLQIESERNFVDLQDRERSLERRESALDDEIERRERADENVDDLEEERSRTIKDLERTSLRQRQEMDRIKLLVQENADAYVRNQRLLQDARTAVDKQREIVERVRAEATHEEPTGRPSISPWSLRKLVAPITASISGAARRVGTMYSHYMSPQRSETALSTANDALLALEREEARLARVAETAPLPGTVVHPTQPPTIVDQPVPIVVERSSYEEERRQPMLFATATEEPVPAASPRYVEQPVVEQAVAFAVEEPRRVLRPRSAESAARLSAMARLPIYSSPSRSRRASSRARAAAAAAREATSGVMPTRRALTIDRERLQRALVEAPSTLTVPTRSRRRVEETSARIVALQQPQTTAAPSLALAMHAAAPRTITGVRISAQPAAEVVRTTTRRQSPRLMQRLAQQRVAAETAIAGRRRVEQALHIAPAEPVVIVAPPPQTRTVARRRVASRPTQPITRTIVTRSSPRSEFVQLVETERRRRGRRNPTIAAMPTSEQTIVAAPMMKAIPERSAYASEEEAPATTTAGESIPPFDEPEEEGAQLMWEDEPIEHGSIEPTSEAEGEALLGAVGGVDPYSAIGEYLPMNYEIEEAPEEYEILEPLGAKYAGEESEESESEYMGDDDDEPELTYYVPESEAGSTSRFGNVPGAYYQMVPDIELLGVGRNADDDDEPLGMYVDPAGKPRYRERALPEWRPEN